MGQSAFPAPRDDDHEDVHWALTTAQSLHSQGDNVEALRWVRKAVAAAVARDHDGRAIELGRVAAELEDSLGVATTQRGKGTRQVTEAAAEEPTLKSVARTVTFEEHGALDEHGGFADQLVDDLDSPTYVDPAKPARSVAVESEPTLVPFTQASAGSDDATPATVDDPAVPVRRGKAVAATLPLDQVPSVTSGAAPAPPGSGKTAKDTFTMPAFRVEDLQGEPSEDDTVHSAPDPTAEAKEPELPPQDERTMPTMGEGAVVRWRVALLAAADGDARVMVLRKGQEPPEGAALAMVIPASTDDAQTIAALLGGKRRGS